MNPDTTAALSHASVTSLYRQIQCTYIVYLHRFILISGKLKKNIWTYYQKRVLGINKIAIYPYNWCMVPFNRDQSSISLIEKALSPITHASTGKSVFAHEGITSGQIESYLSLLYMFLVLQIVAPFH
ncbi:hypothetical protein CI610_03435 [invertebrate metagenome]|uniref:Uncharacterized protein n=1 Tax=invertebrate metagenome TaxID=1711999 RepID=A0A2H9T328_9ZZZZ